MIKLNVLNLVWDNKKKRLNSDFVRVPKAGIRTLKQERNVLMEPKDVNQNIYYMFRDVHAKIDEKFFRKNHVRFDVTVIPPYKVGKEEIKTLGHYHPYLKGKRISYPEIYEVIHGVGMFLLQKKKYGKIVDVILYEGKEGDKIIVPPGYGHITINPSHKVLIMANLVSDAFSSVYKDIIKKHGAAYYGIKLNHKIKFIKNTNYKEKTHLRRLKAKNPFNLIKGKSIYDEFIANPYKYTFLNKPYLYKKQWEEVKCHQSFKKTLQTFSWRKKND